MPVSISREPQQRVEDADDAIDVRHRRVDLRERLLGGGPRQGELFEARAQLRERRAQIVRNRVGDVADAVDELLDLLEHAIDRLRERVELIAAAAGSAADDSSRRCMMAEHGLPNALDARQQRPADHEPTEYADDRQHRDRRGQSVPEMPSASGAKSATDRGPPAGYSRRAARSCTSDRLRRAGRRARADGVAARLAAAPSAATPAGCRPADAATHRRAAGCARRRSACRRGCR